LKKVLTASGFEPIFDTPFFNEFVMKAPKGFEEKRKTLVRNHCIFAGLDIELFYPELKQYYLFCATETVSKEDMDHLAKEVKS
jgi:glycine dehydrogenase subunit 1